VRVERARQEANTSYESKTNALALTSSEDGAVRLKYLSEGRDTQHTCETHALSLSLSLSLSLCLSLSLSLSLDTMICVYNPVEPNPPAPRWVIESSLSSTRTTYTGHSEG